MSLLRTESIPRRGRVKPAAKEVKARPILPAHNLLQLERDAIHRVEFARRKREAEELAGETVSGLDLRDVTRFLTDEHALTPANIVGLHTAQQLAQLRNELAERGQKDSHHSAESDTQDRGVERRQKDIRREAEPDILEEVAGEPDDSLVEAPQPVQAIPEDLRVKRHQFLKRFEPTLKERIGNRSNPKPPKRQELTPKRPELIPNDGELDEFFATPMKPVDLATIATPLMNATMPIDQGANDEVEQAVNSTIDDKFLDALDTFWTNPYPEYSDKSLDKKLRDSSEEAFHSFLASTPKRAEQQIEPNMYSPTAPKSNTEKLVDMASSAMASLWSAAGRVDDLNPIKSLDELFGLSKNTKMEPVEEEVEVEAAQPAPSKRDADTIDRAIKESLDNDGRPSQEEAAEAAEKEGQPAPADPETDLAGDNDSAAGDEGPPRARTKEAKAAASKHERETRERIAFGEYQTLANYVQFKKEASGRDREQTLEALHKNPGILTNLYKVGASTPLAWETAHFWKTYGTRNLLKVPKGIAIPAKKSFEASWDKFRTEHPDWGAQFGKGLDLHHHERQHEHQEHQEHGRRHEHQEHETERYFPEREIQRVIDLRDRGQIDSARTYAMSLRGLLSSVQLNYLLCYITGC